MRLTFLHTFYLLLFGVGVRSEASFNLTEEERARNPALGQIGHAKTIVEESLENLPDLVKEQKPKSINLFKKAIDSKLDAMAKSIDENGELTNGGDSGKIKSVGEAAMATATLIQNAIKGDFSGPEGGKKISAAVISLTETFGNIGGAFAPPPFGQAISTGFGILNTFMTLAGLTPKVPSETDILRQLLNEQTKEIKEMIDEVLEKFWEEVLDKSKGTIAVLQAPIEAIKRHINKPTNVTCAVLMDIKDTMNSADSKIQDDLGQLRSKFFRLCTVKNASDEKQCLILLEIYSEIYKTFVNMNELAMELFNKRENMETLRCRESRKIPLESNRNFCPEYLYKGMVCEYYEKIEKETNNIREDVFNPLFKQIVDGKYQPPFKTSTLCLKIQVLTSGKFNHTKHALQAAGVDLKLTPSEQSSKNIVCPSSKTKLMLVGGWNEKLQILSPNKECKGSFPEFPDFTYYGYRRGAAFYTTRDGDERVMVCGGQQDHGNWYLVTNKCYSINNITGANWKPEANIQKAVMKPSMAFDSYNMHSFGGYTQEELTKYNLKIYYNEWGTAPYIYPINPWDVTDFTQTKALEQIWQMDFTKGSYAWKGNVPQNSGGFKSYNEMYRSFIGARCTVFHDGHFYSQGIKWKKNEIPGPAQYTNKKSYAESLQENLDDYCRTTLPKETPACSDRNFARKDRGAWRCFKSVNTDITALACVDNYGQLVKCSAPLTVGGQYCTRKQLNDILDGKQKIDFTTPIPGCLWGLEEPEYYQPSTLNNCQNICKEKSWCRSLYYVEDYDLCYLSKHTKLSDPDYWKGECYDFTNPNYYMSAKYYAKIIHNTASTIGTWSDLPTYPNSLIYTCTVGVLYGQTSFVTSGPKGVYYLPIPFNPETNPKPKWNVLEEPPTECTAALGWADGKLLCVPANKPRPYTTWNQNFYYFDEKAGRWETKTLDGYTFGLESYVTVSGAFDNKCEK